MLRILFTWWMFVLGAVASEAREATVWNNPVTEQGVYGDGFSKTALDVTKVELKETETLVSLTVTLHHEYQFRFAGTTCLQADGKRYALRTIDGMEPDKLVHTNADDRLEVVFHFEPLPRGTRSFDLIEGEGATDFRIVGIQPAEAYWNRLFPSYWCNERTGDWAVAFLDDCAIYRCKFWTYDRRGVDPKTGKSELVLRCGDETLQVVVGKSKKGRRVIQIGKDKQTYVQLTDRFVPDYPVFDTRAAFADSGNRPDTVTVVGWLRNAPEAFLQEKTLEFHTYAVFDDEETATFTANLDAAGRFTARIPVLNSSKIFSHRGDFSMELPVEPGKTYLLLYDFKEGRRYLMGSDVRLQNELFKYPFYSQTAMMKQGDDLDRYIVTVDSTLKAQYARIEARCKAHPSLSTRYRLYQERDALWSQAFYFGQARYQTTDFRLTETARRYAYNAFWSKQAEPLILNSIAFTFVRDYFGDLYQDNDDPPTHFNIRNYLAEIAGTDEELALLKRWDAVTREDGKQPELSVEEKKELNSKAVKILNGPKANKFIEALGNINLLKNLAAYLDSLRPLPIVRDYLLYIQLYDQIEGSSRAQLPCVVDTLRTLVSCQLVADNIEKLNNRYRTLENRDFDRLSLKSSENLKDLTEGEALLKKILEPYKGTLVLLDIWGTWCGPCKEALKHSAQEYARLSKYNVTYLYLANNSPQDAWENVIKEYNVIGPNVVHYNLPNEQQQAIERYLKVQSFPTYKLFDREGNLLDMKVDARNLDALEALIKRLSNK